FWIDGYTALGTAKRHINDGTFVGHQCGKSHHLVFIDHIAVTDTTLGWRHVLRVLHTPSVDNLQVITPPERETESVNTVANLDLVQQPLGMFGELRCMVKERGYIIEKMVFCYRLSH